MDEASITQIMLLNQCSQTTKFLVIGYIKYTSHKLKLYLPSIICDIVISIYHLFYVSNEELISIAQWVHKKQSKHLGFITTTFKHQTHIITGYIQYYQKQFSLKIPTMIYTFIELHYHRHYDIRKNVFDRIYYRTMELRGICEVNEIVQHLIYDLAINFKWTQIIDIPTSHADIIKFKYSDINNIEQIINIRLNLNNKTISMDIIPLNRTWQGIPYTEITKMMQNIHYLMSKTYHP